MFKLTAAAALQVQKAAKQGNAEGMPLRLAASRGSDGTIEYRMGFDDAKSEDDIPFKSEGIDIVTSPEDIPLLDDAVMDFVELEKGQPPHFIFLNPKDSSYKAPSDA